MERFTTDQFDFSKCERLVPRRASFQKVLARIEFEERKRAAKCRRFGTLSIAASVVLIFASVFLEALSQSEWSLPLNALYEQEQYFWSEAVGDSEGNDGFAVLDASYTMSYLTTEVE